MEENKANYKILNIDETEYVTTLTKKFETREKWTEPDLRLIRSYIPGTIRQVLVAEGQKVKKGDKLLIIEAMKMMTNFASPIDGIVKSIKVTVGTVVAKNEILVELE